MIVFLNPFQVWYTVIKISKNLSKLKYCHPVKHLFQIQISHTRIDIKSLNYHLWAENETCGAFVWPEAKLPVTKNSLVALVRSQFSDVFMNLSSMWHLGNSPDTISFLY